MELTLDETQTLVQKTAREYATRVILPEAAAIDREERFPKAILKGLAELGLMAVNVPEELGGAAAGPVSYALAMQEVARACASTAVTMAVTNMVGARWRHVGARRSKAVDHQRRLRRRHGGVGAHG
jgi:alkylation response protein AidB-like acyl-CoA dehydrogenase